MSFTIIREDLARVHADAIVVPANKYLEMDGGTGLAVAKAAGRRRLQRACRRLGGCPVGQAVATPAFRLEASHIIHAVGPVWHGGTHDEARLLRSAYDNALNLALRLNAQSVALPLLSAGTFGYPIREAFEIAVDAIRTFLETADMDVLLVLYDKRAVIEGSRQFGEIAEYIDDAYTEQYSPRRLNMSRSRADYEEWLAAPIEPDYDLSLGVDSVPLAEETGSLPAVKAQESVDSLYCPQCGHKYLPGSSFCQQCGHPLDGRPASLTWGAWDGALPPEDAPVGASRTESYAAPAPPMSAPHVAFAGHAMQAAPHFAPAETIAAPARDASPDLSTLLAHMDDSFSMMLMKLIDARGLSDAQVYKRANISRQHFSKMRNPGYKPTKKTVVALAVALELSLDDTQDLLARAGFALSHSSKFDIIVEYFIGHGKYDIFTINEALFAYDQPLLD